MRYISSILVIMFFIQQVAAQTKQKLPTAPKTVPGILTEDARNISSPPINRSAVAFSFFDKFTIIDLSKGTIRNTANLQRVLGPDGNYQYNVSQLSPDYKFQYNSSKNFVKLPGAEKAEYLLVTSVKNMQDGTGDTLIGNYFIFGMDNDGHLIGSKAILHPVSHNFSWLIGLYTLDRKTGGIISTLRADTIYALGRFGCCGGYDGRPEEWSLQTAYLLIRHGKHKAQVFPFSDTSVISITTWYTGELKADITTEDHFFYELNEAYKGYSLTAYDRRTGSKAGIFTAPYGSQSNFLFAAGPKQLYHYDLNTGQLYTDEVGNGKFILRDSMRIPGLLLPTSQTWSMHIGAGPTAIFLPRNMRIAETEGAASNMASLVSLNNRNISMRIAPFYNRNNDAIALEKEEAKIYAAGADERAKQDAIKKAAKLAKLCKDSWNNEKYARGITRSWEQGYVILESYDCNKDEYRIFRPVPPNEMYNDSKKPSFSTEKGELFRTFSQASTKQYITCTVCDGLGRISETTTKTRTKDLPWGYFSGIETKSTRTTTTTEIKACTQCGGHGILLK